MAFPSRRTEAGPLCASSRRRGNCRFVDKSKLNHSLRQRILENGEPAGALVLVTGRVAWQRG